MRGSSSAGSGWEGGDCKDQNPSVLDGWDEGWRVAVGQAAGDEPGHCAGFFAAIE